MVVAVVVVVVSVLAIVRYEYRLLYEDSCQLMLMRLLVLRCVCKRCTFLIKFKSAAMTA